MSSALAASAAEDDITLARQRSADLFVAITGVRVGIDDPRLVEMEALVAKGDERGAVKVATRDPAFYDVRLQAFAKKLSTRDENVIAPLTDFVATFVGAVRDDIDARELLTGNFYYRFDSTNLTPAQKTNLDRDNPAANSNMHYSRAQNLNLSLHRDLIKVEGQITMGDGPIKDPAGLLTTRAFMQAHAEAGTNRRIVEYTFREFMCTPMIEMADATRPDDWVGRDVDRFAGGGTTRYQVTCKGCHTQLDGFRGAFAYVNFPNNSITFSPDVPLNARSKYARNPTIFPKGYETKDDTWVNYANGTVNSDRFGWRSTKMSGKGVHEFGVMIAASKGYSRCLARRIFTDVCKRTPLPSEETTVRDIATDFEKTYKIKDLVEMIAVHPSCLLKVEK